MTQRRFSIRRAGTLALSASGVFLLVVSAANAQEVCVGDCGQDGTVAINELIIGVNIALDAQPVSACPEFACTDGTSVPINCLVTGVNNALEGCPTTGNCPLDAGEYTITSIEGGMLR